jgi:hypothetical protein
LCHLIISVDELSGKRENGGGGRGEEGEGKIAEWQKAESRRKVKGT